MDYFWKESRLAAGLKQAEAAQALYISPSQLSKVESGARLPSPELLLQMAALYHDPKLPGRYCREVCPFHQDDGMQDLRLSDTEEVSERVQASVLSLQHIGSQLVDILEDGQIDAAEYRKLQSFRRTLEEVSRDAKALKLWAQQSGVVLEPEAGAAAAQHVQQEQSADIYTLARRRAGYSNYQKAALALGMDRDRLSSIENGQVTPRAEEVLRLSEFYQAPELKSFYCSWQCAIGMQHRPVSELPEHISLAMLSALYHVEHIREDLRHLLADGQITPDETTAFRTLVNRLNNLIFASDSLLALLDAH